MKVPFYNYLRGTKKQDQTKELSTTETEMLLQHTPPSAGSDTTTTRTNQQENPVMIIQEPDPQDRTTTSVGAVHVAKIPPFWKDNPILWFLQLEAAFAINRIQSDDSKYRFVIVYLDQTILPIVADILLNSPETGKYNKLKERLISALGESTATRIRRLLGSHEIGDEKPSVFLQQLRNLAGAQASDGILRAIFLEQLPENVRTILAISKMQDLDKLAAQADKIVEIAKPRSTTINAVTQQQQTSNGLDNMTDLTTEINFLTRELRRSRRPRSTSRNRQIWRKSHQMRSTLFLEEKCTGKLRSPSRLQAIEDGVPRTQRLTITDKNDKITYLIDTGADVSVLPKRLVRGTLHPTSFKLFAANNTAIKTYGSQIRILNLGLRRQYRWNFIIADVQHPIIGADLLGHHGLLPDLKRRKLIDEKTLLSTNTPIKTTTATTIATVDKGCKYESLLRKYIDITRPTAINQPTHEVFHHIETHGPPVAERARRLAPDRLAAAKREFEGMMEQGICRPSSSQWASPLHMVKKPNGSWRACGDYRRLNNSTVPDKYPLPHIHDFTNHLAGCKIFSKIDLVKAFYQIPVAKEDVCKTAVITPFGVFEFTRMPFGLSNAAQSF
ncbi:uncharacterized protein [Cardiocondyla obscurior]|uniref:uncharacterized protein n=1 Tax=Cardiocondyla obscurior TaxID=286306 RepID=UPI003965764B